MVKTQEEFNTRITKLRNDYDELGISVLISKIVKIEMKQQTQWEFIEKVIDSLGGTFSK